MGTHRHYGVPIFMASLLAVFSDVVARSVSPESMAQRRGSLPSIFHDIEWNVNFAMLLLSLLCGILWISYISLYNSRIAGSVLTRVARALLGDCGASVHIGSFSFSALAGKVMFRELWLFTEDYTIRVLDGALIFRYWLPVDGKASGITSFRTRLTFLLNGFEMNVYNQLFKYRDLELFLSDSRLSAVKEEVKLKKKSYTSAYGPGWWLEMFPQIRVCISSGRFTLGNSHLPTTLFCAFENVDFTYYALDSRDKDEFSGSCESVSVSLVKSLGFTGPFEPPPRLMGRGFEVVQSSHVTFKHCHAPILQSGSSTDSQTTATFSRCNVLTLLLGKGTSLRYGPWADKQRDSLYNFFYPFDYAPNCDYIELARRTVKYVLQIEFCGDATLDLLFMKNDVPNNVHLNVAKGSTIQAVLPFMVEANVWQNRVDCKLLEVEMLISLGFRQFLQSHRLTVTIDVCSPPAWCDPQKWDFGLEFDKTTAWLVFDQKQFVNDLLEEWVTPVPSDIYKYFLYSMNVDINFRDVQLIFPVNSYNFIDTSSQNAENCLTALYLMELHAVVSSPSSNYCSETDCTAFSVTGSSALLRVHIPEQHTYYAFSTSTCTTRESNRFVMEELNFEANAFVKENFDDWINCWAAKRIVLTGRYQFHKMLNCDDKNRSVTVFYDVFTLAPDMLCLDLDVTPCNIVLMPFVVSCLWNFKENYFGDWRSFTDLTAPASNAPHATADADVSLDSVVRYRPLDVQVRVTLTSVRAMLSGTCLEEAAMNECGKPLVCLDKLSFEMEKYLGKACFQVALSPCLLTVVKGNGVSACNTSLNLSGLQMRAEDYFSTRGCLFSQTPVEYAWMMEFVLGELRGGLPLKETCCVVQEVCNFVSLMCNAEEDLLPPTPPPSMNPKEAAPKPDGTASEDPVVPSSDERYFLARFSLDVIDILVLERNVVASLYCRCLRFSSCSGHWGVGRGGCTFLIGDVIIAAFVKVDATMRQAYVTSLGGSAAYVPRTACGSQPKGAVLLECLRMQSRKICFLSSDRLDENKSKAASHFLTFYDCENQGLSFVHAPPQASAGQMCACVGKSAFYSSVSPRDAFDALVFLHGDGSSWRPLYPSVTEATIPVDEDRSSFGRTSPTDWFSMPQHSAELRSFSSSSWSLSSTEEFFDAAYEAPCSRHGDELSETPPPSASSFVTIDDNIKTSPVRVLYDHFPTVLKCPPVMLSYYELLGAYELVERGLTAKCGNEFLKERKQATKLLSRVCPGLQDLEINPRDADAQSNFVSAEAFLFCDQPSCEDVSLWTDHGVQLFTSPLGVEAIGLMLNLCEPAFFYGLVTGSTLLVDQFVKCSRRKHNQLLVDQRARFGWPVSTGRFRVAMPAVTFRAMQCGLLEKALPADQIRNPLSLSAVSVGILLVHTPGGCFQAALGADGAANANRRRLSGSFDVGRAEFQLLQISDKDTAVVGIPLRASRLSFAVSLQRYPQHYMCNVSVVAEGVVNGISLSVRHMSPPLIDLTKWNSYKQLLSHQYAPLPEEEEGERREGDALATLERANKNDVVDTETFGTHLQLSFSTFLLNCSLLQQLELSAKLWPLYDVLSPSIASWQQAINRINDSFRQSHETVNMVEKLVLISLMADAMDSSKLQSTHKSKFSQRRLNRALLEQCPSCQLTLALMRYCATESHEAYNKRKVAPMVTVGSPEWSDHRRLNQIIVSLLSHWREILSAEKLVNLNDNLARDFVLNKDGGDLMDATSRLEHMDRLNLLRSSVADIGSPEVTERQSLLHPASEVPKGTADGRPSLHRIRFYAEKRRMGRRRNKVPSEQGGGSKMKSSTLEMTKDLYGWMAKEQQAERKLQQQKKANVGHANDTVNPMDIPLEVYFSVFLEERHLLRVPLCEYLAKIYQQGVNAALTVQSVSLLVTEPREFQMSADTLKRVTFAERSLCTLEKMYLSLSAWTNASKWEAHQRRLTVVRQFHYRIDLKGCTLCFGYPALVLINQMQYVIRALFDQDAHYDRIFENSVKTLLSTLPVDPSLLLSAQHLSSEQVARVRWASRASTILHDFRRAKKAFLRRCVFLKFDDESMYELLRKVDLKGNADINRVEVRALFTELMVGVDMQFLEMKHDCSASGNVTRDEELMNNADNALEFSVRRIDLHLSDAETNLTNFRTVFQMAVEQSTGSFSSMATPNEERPTKNCVAVRVGPVTLDIPLHPGTLHGVVLRGTRTISERMPMLLTPSIVEEVMFVRTSAPLVAHTRHMFRKDQVAVVHFNIVVKSINVSAALLPSLKASYRMDEAHSSGVTGSAANFIVAVPSHNITFDVKGLAASASCVAPFIQMSFPPLKAKGCYIQAHEEESFPTSASLVVKKGGYLNINAEIGAIRHTLTTDLLNQLLFTEETFTRELTEIIQKIASERVSFSAFSQSNRLILYSLTFTVWSVSITATTPTAIAVRLEAEQVRLHFSNRLLHRSKDDSFERVQWIADMALSLTLGQLIRSMRTKNEETPAQQCEEDIEPEFQRSAFLKTRVTLQNVDAPQNGHDQEPGGINIENAASSYFVALRQPVLYVQPRAVDKAILLWLNYKNTYEFWNEQHRQYHSKEATERGASEGSNRPEMHVFDQFQQHARTPKSTCNFLQFTLDEGLHICLPCYDSGGSSRLADEFGCALIFSLQSTRISVCSCGPLVSRGMFHGFCVYFLEQFDSDPENWMPRVLERKDFSKMNAWLVTEGTYDICSETRIPNEQTSSGALWVLNIMWNIKGLDMHFNTKIIHLGTILCRTLTSLASEHDTLKQEEVLPQTIIDKEDQKADRGASEAQMDESALSFRERTKFIERRMIEQSRMLTDLAYLGASEGMIEVERRKLQRLETFMYNELRRDFFQRIKKQSHKLSASSRDTRPTNVTWIANAEPLRKFQRAPSLTEPHSVSLSSPEDGSVEQPERHRTQSVIDSLVGPSRKEAADSVAVDKARLHDLQLPVILEQHDQQRSPSSPERCVTARGDSRTVSDSLSEPISVGANSSFKSPAVDFLLDFRVHVESGRCTFEIQNEDPEEEPVGDFPFSRQSSGGSRFGRKKTFFTRFKSPTDASTRSMVVHLPGLSIKAHYRSKSTSDMAATGPGSTSHPLGSSSKKGEFHMWISLESMPEETVLSPLILDFVEEALEIASARSTSRLLGPTSSHSVDWAGMTSDVEQLALQAASAAVESFPVDVFVFFSVQASCIRFTSLPYSMVECYLKLPELQLMFTYGRSAVDHLRRTAALSEQYAHIVEGSSNGLLNTGLMVTTLTLSEFSLYIFHRYGVRSLGRETMSERRDAFIVQVRSVSINMARSSRYLAFHESFTTEVDPRSSANHQMGTRVQFSVSAHISEATLKFDMRRLKEILSFPKAWYRRAIMRRLFFGEEEGSKGHSGARSNLPEQEGAGPRIQRRHTFSSVPAPSSVSSSSSQFFTCQSNSAIDRLAQTSAKVVFSGWQAFVICAVSVERISVEAVMGQVMGQTTWRLRKTAIQGKIFVTSRKRKQAAISCIVQQSSLEARGGLVSGMINLNLFDGFATLVSAPWFAPRHTLGITQNSIEAKVEWMSTTIFMLFVTAFKCRLVDQWKIISSVASATAEQTMEIGPEINDDQFSVLLKQVVEWDTLEALMTRNTVYDFRRIYLKLYEFFDQQFRSGRMILFHELGGAPGDLQRTDEAEGARSENESESHSCWHQPLEMFTKLQLKCSNTMPFLKSSLALGSRIRIKGARTSLACFHGSTFSSSQQWALFHLRQLAVEFRNRARDVVRDQHLHTSVVQVLTCRLGHRGSSPDSIMAVVLRCQRSQYWPTQLSMVKEWFQYACGAPLSGVFADAALAGSKANPYRVNMSALFKIPCFRVCLTMDHLVLVDVDEPEERVPRSVDCQLTSDFDNCVLVTHELESLNFLRELVSSYVISSYSGPRGTDISRRVAGTGQRVAPASGDVYPMTDNRTYSVRHWDLKPHVQWMGTVINVDRIMMLLGFKKPRETIPKWIQRGLLDALDEYSAYAVQKLLELNG